MVSQMAMEDIETLQKQGINVTPKEIVKLNALGVKAEHSPNASSFFALPRCAFLGSGENQVVFREPTIGQQIWLENVCRVYDEDDDTTLFFLRAFSMTREDLPEWTDLKEVKSKIRQFIIGLLAKFTVRQIVACVNYCLNGSDADEHEDPITQKKDTTDSNDILDTFDEETPWSDEIGVVREAQAIGLGISMADAKQMTMSELQQVIQMAYRKKDIPVDKNAKNRAIGEYYATLEAIKNKHIEQQDEVKQNG